MGSFFQQLQSLDRRWIYLLLSIVLITALIVGKLEKPVVQLPARQLFDAVEASPAGADDDKIILVGTTFSFNTIGESGNQARAILRHLMLTKKRFAVMSVEPVGAEIGKIITTKLAEEYNYEYGKDWIFFGYQLGTLAFFKSFPQDIPGTVKIDGIQGNPITDFTAFPIMRRVKTIKDVDMHIEITASASVFDWLQIVQPVTKPRLKIGYACTGVMAAEAYPYLDSGQMVGMLPGLKGAADYEQLVEEREKDFPEVKADASTSLASIPRIGLYRTARHLMFAQGSAHVLIILFIILGNIGYFLARRKPRSKEAMDE
jgi:hypothetical protein